MLKEYHTRTRNTVVGTGAPITARLEALERMQTCTPLFVPQVAANIAAQSFTCVC